MNGNNFPTRAADLAKVIQELGLQDIVLVGWSTGCLETWGYIRQEGIRNVKAMVCIDISPKPLSVNPNDWVEGPLDEIAGAYNSVCTAAFPAYGNGRFKWTHDVLGISP